MHDELNQDKQNQRPTRPETNNQTETGEPACFYRGRRGAGQRGAAEGHQLRDIR